MPPKRPGRGRERADQSQYEWGQQGQNRGRGRGNQAQYERDPQRPSFGKGRGNQAQYERGQQEEQRPSFGRGRGNQTQYERGHQGEQRLSSGGYGHTQTQSSAFATTSQYDRPYSRQRIQSTDVPHVGLELQQRLKLNTGFPMKPEPGKLGRKIQLISNCFPMTIPAGLVYHYDVNIFKIRHDVSSDEDSESEKEDLGNITEEVMQKHTKTKSKKYKCLSTKLNRKVIDLMVKADNLFRNVHPAFDGRKNLYTRNPLEIDKVFKCKIELDSDNPRDSDDPRGRKTDTFQIVVKPVKNCAISLDLLHDLYAGRCSSVPEDAIMAIETILRHTPCLKYIPIGRSFFFPPADDCSSPLGKVKEVWFGYHQSMRLGQGKPLVNLDLSATAFYQERPLLDYVMDFFDTNKHNLNKIYPDNYKLIDLSSELSGLWVKVTHGKTKSFHRKYCIEKFSNETADSNRFPNKKGSIVTVKQYFFEEYNLKLEFPNLPLVKVKSKDVFLPIEVCIMEKGQHCRKELAPEETAGMIKVTGQPPKERFGRIRELIDLVDYNKDPYLEEFGIKIEENPIQVAGRVINAPTLIYKSNNADNPVRPRDGQWNLRDQKFFEEAIINSWILLSFDNVGFRDLQKFAEFLYSFGNKQGITIEKHKDIKTMNEPLENLPECFEKFRKEHGIELIVAIIPDRKPKFKSKYKNSEVYTSIKKAEQLTGIPTSCITRTNAYECKLSLLSNVCLKINAKMGGINHMLKLGEVPLLLKENIMIMGADLNHSGPSAVPKPSLAAVVGSLDNHPSRYAVEIRPQYNKNEKKCVEEVIQSLEEMVLKLLNAYISANSKKPDKIIFFRDGVSDGQFIKVRDEEIKSVRSACLALEPKYSPKLTYITVQKRHHVKFKPQDERDGVGRERNIPPGTVVDTTVCHPLYFDFFLCSHNGLKGTSKSGHYTVLTDDNSFTADNLQKLTYSLCHTFVRCTKSISLPAPVQYAHLAAYRARLYLTTEEKKERSAQVSRASSKPPLTLSDIVQTVAVKDDLKDKLFYI